MDLYIKCECSLEEFFYGCKKEVYYQRLDLDGDGRSEQFILEKKEIIVKPGMGPWTVIKFPGEGHERYAKERSDLIVKFK